MQKGNPADLRGLAEDLERAIHDHEDAMKHNPDIAADVEKARDKAQQRYERIREQRPIE